MPHYMSFSSVLLTLLFLFLFLGISYHAASGQDYESEWKEVEKLLKDNLTRSALEQVEAIQTQTQQDENQPQLVKAIVYRVGLMPRIEEKADSLALTILDAEIERAPQPTKAILQSIKAQQLMTLYQMNRWRINDRSYTDVRPEDIDTWDAKTYFEAIRELHFAALEPRELLIETPVRDFEAILDTAEESPTYRPSLYDLLAFKALDFFTNDATNLPRPGETYQIPAELAFVSTEEFIQRSEELGDAYPDDRDFLTVQLYHDLLAYHQEKGLIAPLIDAELSRLRLMKNRLNPSAGTFRATLQQLAVAHADHAASTMVLHRLAESWVETAGDFDPIRPIEPSQGAYQQAHEICQQAIEKFPESLGARRCTQLLNQIERQSLQLQVETTNLPDQPFRALITHRNVDQAHIRVVRLTDDLRDRIVKAYQSNNSTQKVIRLLRNEKPLRQQTVALPATEDYHAHRMEVVVEPLSLGSYYLLISDHNEFDPGKGNFAYAEIQVSNLTYLATQLPDNRHQFDLREAQSGAPAEDVKAELYFFNQERQWPKTPSQTRYTDADGQLIIEMEEEIRAVRVEFSRGDDLLKPYQISLWGDPYRDRLGENRARIHLFTDRAIYRPGQTIYFKGIATIQKDLGEYEVSADRKVQIELRDVNQQVVSELELTTNEYGSFSGSFTAPQGGLTGRMTLHTAIGQASVRVEEYKRPTFEVKLDTLSGDYALGDSVSLSGNAKSYSGVNLSGAEVRYRVVRRARFPYWYFWWRPMPSSPEQEIAQGSVQADEQGKFTLDFLAKPDPDIDPDTKPIFTYEVSVDVIDISGETHSASKSLRLGYVRLEVNLSTAKLIDSQEPGSLSISTTNLDGSFVPTAGTLRIYRLDAPRVPLRPRRWAQPDQYELASLEAYRESFPHDVYGSQDDAQTWERMGEPIFTQQLNTGESRTIDLDFLEGETKGAYVAEFLTEEDSLKATARFSLFDSEAPQPPVAAWLETKLSKSSAEPGEAVQLTLMTSEPELFVHYELWWDNQRIDSAWLHIEDGNLTRKILVDESHRGGLTVHLAYFRENHYEQQNLSITVPWTNKQLSLEWETFRSPLLPGQEEEWRLTIKGSEAEAVAAEMVATLYDASLESFVSHNWSLNLYPTLYSRLNQSARDYRSTGTRQLSGWASAFQVRPGAGQQGYDRINPLDGSNIRTIRGKRSLFSRGTAHHGELTMIFDAAAPPFEPTPEAADMGGPYRADGEAQPTFALVRPKSDTLNTPGSQPETPPTVSPRTNLNETAFFFPDLRTNEQGEVVLSFTMPEALTRWRFMGLAHTQDMQVGMLEGETVTQKELMVTPNLPRYFREGDQMQLSAKVSNLSDSTLDGWAYLELFDAVRMQPLDEAFANVKNGRSFTVDPDGSVAVSWAITVPEGVQAISVRITAKAGNFTDGEEKILPVLSNRMLVTESRPFIVRGNDRERFEWKKLVDSDDSETLRHHQVTLEITENPVWYAVQALPYLMEYPYECTEQIFSRYYANALASNVARSQPQFQRVFEQWRDLPDSEALLSQLDKNEELKSALLSETPWVMDAASENDRKRRLGLLFDLNHMAQQQQTAYQQLLQRQNSDGSFSWYPGMRGSRYITQLVVNGLGHLEKLGVTSYSSDPEISQMLSKAMAFLDGEIAEDFRELKRRDADLEKNHLGYSQIQYLYGRSFFPQFSAANSAQQAVEYYAGQAETYWTEQSFYMQGMLSLVFFRDEKEGLSQQVLAALMENTVRTNNRGYYWKGATGWFWYQAPIERQAMLIEAFHEIGGYDEEVEEMNLWLLQQKRTQDWGSTRATVGACNALLMTQGDWTQTREPLDVRVAGRRIDAQQEAENAVEAGTGYYQVRWDGSEVTPRLGEVRIDNPNPGPAWGALYWQYFEDLDRITAAETPLSLRKQLYKVENTPDGEELIALADGATLTPGDRLRIRVEIRVDRAMSYVHFKDMRAAGLEPVETLSGYEYQGGLGYYRSIRDASTNFFFETLPQGTWVLEYDLRANLPGTYSNGIATLQCFYAPEYSSHSAGVKVEVNE